MENSAGIDLIVRAIAIVVFILVVVLSVFNDEYENASVTEPRIHSKRSENPES